MFNKRQQDDASLEQRLEEAKRQIRVSDSPQPVREWWNSLEKLNEGQMHLVLKLADELERRNVTISDFFDVWKYSHLEDVEANLSLLDTLIQDREALI